MCGCPTRCRSRCPGVRSSPGTGRPACTAGARRPASTTWCRAAAGAPTPGTTWSPPAGAATTPRPTGRWPRWAGRCRTRRVRPAARPGGCSGTGPSTRGGVSGWACPTPSWQEESGVPATARRLWALGEPFHALTYFADEARTAFDAVGLRGFWAGYFAGRAAPLGAVGPELVTATFASFAPAFVARRVPGVWATTPPQGALAARLAGVDAAVQRALPGWADSVEAKEAASPAPRAAEAGDALRPRGGRGGRRPGPAAGRGERRPAGARPAAPGVVAVADDAARAPR